MQLVNMQLGSRSAPLKSQIAAVPSAVNASQVGSPLTVWVKPAAVSLMQVVYSATVAVQSVGILLQPVLLFQATAGSARQPPSFCVQTASPARSDYPPIPSESRKLL